MNETALLAQTAIRSSLFGSMRQISWAVATCLACFLPNTQPGQRRIGSILRPGREGGRVDRSVGRVAHTDTHTRTHARTNAHTYKYPRMPSNKGTQYIKKYVLFKHLHSGQQKGTSHTCCVHIDIINYHNNTERRWIIYRILLPHSASLMSLF